MNRKAVKQRSDTKGEDEWSSVFEDVVQVRIPESTQLVECSHRTAVVGLWGRLVPGHTHLVVPLAKLLHAQRVLEAILYSQGIITEELQLSYNTGDVKRLKKRCLSSRFSGD